MVAKEHNYRCDLRKGSVYANQLTIPSREVHGVKSSDSSIDSYFLLWVLFEVYKVALGYLNPVLGMPWDSSQCWLKL
ncbi:hypothetical protein MRB53_017084 [Persea americana]|uniref:Uncharacterized protein n=1 Tax=Persea americana TaxID=3435 RepID=A0ACC2M406_PERAE|nr:hypothetical protein MRB53_017084 [Persea americana]